MGVRFQLFSITMSDYETFQTQTSSNYTISLVWIYVFTLSEEFMLSQSVFLGQPYFHNI